MSVSRTDDLAALRRGRGEEKPRAARPSCTDLARLRKKYWCDDVGSGVPGADRR